MRVTINKVCANLKVIEDPMEIINQIVELLEYPVILIVWIHFIADFVLQSDSMATKKSSSNKWLSLHIAVYTLPWFYFGWVFAIVNGVAHFITDYITSRMTSRLWKAGQIHWFFVVIGFDQAIHLTTLFITYAFLVGF